MDDRRRGERHIIAFPVRVKWKDENGKQLTEEGLTENIGPRGVLVFLPHKIPQVGVAVDLTITENADDEVTVSAEVLRVVRDAAHPQAALHLTKNFKIWKEKVWEYAGEILANEEPEEFDDW